LRRLLRPPCFDAVVFDLDGTLVATDRFWIESADRGARRAFRELGLERTLPTSEQWMSLVGLPLDVGFRSLFPELTEAQRFAVIRACVEEEEALLGRDGVPAMPEAREVVRSLAEQGLAVGIASNCEQSYLERMLRALELGDLVRAAYCRESPGIASKADMVARLLADFGTRSAVMVGDRSSDRDAAWQNGIPHVHCAFGFAQGDEVVEAEGRIAALPELLPLLARRAAWITRALDRVGAFSRPGLRIGVTGGPGAGKSLFARDAGRLLAERGHPVAAVSLEGFAPGHPPSDADPLEGAVDLERLASELLRPHEAGQEVPLARPDLLGQERVPAGAVLVLEGDYLLGAKLRTGINRLIHLDVAEVVSWRRARGREVRPEGSQAPTAAVEEALSLQRALEQRFPPRVAADLVLDGTNPLGA
jgi:phosphoglycolate phosphatase-like HAD superfamily hydrolase